MALALGLAVVGWWWSRTRLSVKYEGARIEFTALSAALDRLKVTNEELACHLAQHLEAQAEWTEQAKRQGARLAMRTVEHELNNKLAVIAGWDEVLSAESTASPRLHTAGAEVVRNAEEVAQIVQQRRQLTWLAETDWGPSIPPTIDIPRSLD